MKRTLGWLFAVLLLFAFILAFFGIRSMYVHDYDETVTVGKIGSEEGYKIRVCSICGKTEKVALTAEDAVEDNTVTFGFYPQDRVDGEIAEDLSKAYSNPTRRNKNGWTFVDGSYYYRDVTYEGKEYRGLYLAAANPCFKGGENSNQKANEYEVGKTYWFAFAPIAWTASEIDGQIVLTSEKILDARYASAAEDAVSSAFAKKLRKVGFSTFGDNMIDGEIVSAASPAAHKVTDYAAALGLFVFGDDLANGCGYWWSADRKLVNGSGTATEMSDTYLGGIVPSLVFKP